jgi:hypothetical protein
MADEFYAEKHSVVMEMYVHTADENYITARWCYQNALYVDFFWGALHALEKYMKAVLLLNGERAIEGHDLPKLYAKLDILAGPLLPAMLTQPPEMGWLPSGWWRDRTPAQFMDRLYDNGNADNRYQTYGFNKVMEELHMVDAMVHAIRRLVVPLDEPVAPGRPSSPTYRKLLATQAHYDPKLGMPLDHAINNATSPLHFWTLNNNYAFAPRGFCHGSEEVTTSARTAVLSRRIIEPLRSRDRAFARSGYQLADWFLTHTKAPKAVRTQIEAEMRDALSRHPSIDI